MAAVGADGVARAPTQRKIDGVVRTRHHGPALRPERHDLHRRPGDAHASLVDVEHDVFRAEANHLVPRTAAHITIQVAADAGPLRGFGHRLRLRRSWPSRIDVCERVASRQPRRRSTPEAPRRARGYRSAAQPLTEGSSGRIPRRTAQLRLPPPARLDLTYGSCSPASAPPRSSASMPISWTWRPTSRTASRRSRPWGCRRAP